MPSPARSGTFREWMPTSRRCDGEGYEPSARGGLAAARTAPGLATADLAQIGVRSDLRRQLGTHGQKLVFVDLTIGLGKPRELAGESFDVLEAHGSGMQPVPSTYD